MKKQLIVQATLCALVVSGGVLAATVTIPNPQFAAGTPARASEVNGNFTAVATAINTTDGELNAVEADVATLQTDVTALQTDGCPADMTEVGDFCVDTFEAHLIDSNGGITSASLCDETGASCSDTPVNAATAIFAQNNATAVPAASITWFQAAQACANVGKRLPTNAEWQMAAAGSNAQLATAGAGTDCNIFGGGTGSATAPANGAGSNCRSNYGAINMIGNVQEWVADWSQAGGTSTPTNATNSTTYGADNAIAVQAADLQGNGNNFPAAIYRGGDYNAGNGGANAGEFAIAYNAAPSAVFPTIGFRCAMNR